MTNPKVAIRLGTEGKADVKRDFAEVGDAGDAAANRAARAFDKASRDIDKTTQDIESATRRQAAAFDKIRAIGGTAFLSQPTQSVIDARQGGGPSARDMGATFSALAAQERELEQRALALRAAIDPAWAAQQRFNQEMAEARTLIAAGAITLDEYSKKLWQEQAALGQTTIARNKATASSGAMRAGMQQLGFQAQDFVVQIVSGTDATRAFAMQAPQAIGALQMMANSSNQTEGKLAAFARILSGPVGIGLGVAIPLIVMLGEKLLSSGKDADTATDKINRLTKAYEGLAGALNKAGRAAVEQEGVAAIKLRQDEVEVERLRRAAKLADERLASSQKVDPTGRGSAPQIRQAEEARSALKLAEQQLATSRKFLELFGQRRQEAEARDAARDAQRPSSRARHDGDAATPSQVSKMLVEQIGGTITSTTGGKHTKGSYHYRGQAVDFVPAGGMSSVSKDDIRAIAEAAGLTVVELLGPGDKGHNDHFHLAWSGGKGEIDSARTMDKVQADRDRPWLALEKERNAWLNDQSQNIGKLATEQLEKEGEALQERRELIQGLNDDISAGTVLLNTEWNLRGKSREEIAAAVELERYKIDLQRQGLTVADADYQALIRRKEEQEAFNQAIANQQREWAETQRIGEAAIDRLFDPTSAESWGDRVKGVLRDLAMEMFKLAAINPLKNMLFGSGLPTGGGSGGLFGSLLGGLGGLFGGGGDIVIGGAANNLMGSGGIYGNPGALDGMLPRFPGSAIGHEYTPGGAMWVGENGPELLNLPRGSKVMTASDSQRASASNDNRPNVSIPISIDATGADAAGLARVEAKLDQLKRDLPGVIVSTVDDAEQRLMLRRYS